MGCTSNEASILCFVPWEFLLILVAVHLPSKVFIFVLTDGIKEFVFTSHVPDTWIHGRERAAVSRKYHQSRSHPLTIATEQVVPFPVQGVIPTINLITLNPKAQEIPSHSQLNLLMIVFFLSIIKIVILGPCHCHFP
jgi:hypothetical protein